MLANGVELDFGTPRETIVRMAWDRMQEAEIVKTTMTAQAALMIHSAVMALGEGGGSSDAASRLKELANAYTDLLRPLRVVEREEAMEKGKARLAAEEGKGYRVVGRADPAPKGSGVRKRPRKGGLLHGRRKPKLDAE